MTLDRTIPRPGTGRWERIIDVDHAPPSARRPALRVALAAALLCLAAASPAPAASPKYERTEVAYTMPDVTLVNQHGDRVRLLDLMESGKPVLVDFIYATCTTICPVLSAGYANLQKKLGAETQDVHLVSFTIDPEHDTPELMAEYLKRYRAKPGWDFFTGSRADIDRVMRAFDAYVENKMSHYPITFLKGPRDEKWVRIYGLLSTADLLAEYGKLQK